MGTGRLCVIFSREKCRAATGMGADGCVDVMRRGQGRHGLPHRTAVLKWLTPGYLQGGELDAAGGGRSALESVGRRRSVTRCGQRLVDRLPGCPHERNASP